MVRFSLLVIILYGVMVYSSSSSSNNIFSLNLSLSSSSKHQYNNNNNTIAINEDEPIHFSQFTLVLSLLPHNRVLFDTCQIQPKYGTFTSSSELLLNSSNSTSTTSTIRFGQGIISLDQVNNLLSTITYVPKSNFYGLDVLVFTCDFFEKSVRVQTKTELGVVIYPMNDVPQIIAKSKNNIYPYKSVLKMKSLFDELYIIDYDDNDSGSTAQAQVSMFVVEFKTSIGKLELPSPLSFHNYHRFSESLLFHHYQAQQAKVSDPSTLILQAKSLSEINQILSEIELVLNKNEQYNKEKEEYLTIKCHEKTQYDKEVELESLTSSYTLRFHIAPPNAPIKPQIKFTFPSHKHLHTHNGVVIKMKEDIPEKAFLKDIVILYTKDDTKATKYQLHLRLLDQHIGVFSLNTQKINMIQGNENITILDIHSNLCDDHNETSSESKHFHDISVVGTIQSLQTILIEDILDFIPTKNWHGYGTILIGITNAMTANVNDESANFVEEKRILVNVLAKNDRPFFRLNDNDEQTLQEGYAAAITIQDDFDSKDDIEVFQLSLIDYNLKISTHDDDFDLCPDGIYTLQISLMKQSNECMTVLPSFKNTKPIPGSFLTSPDKDNVMTIKGTLDVLNQSLERLSIQIIREMCQKVQEERDDERVMLNISIHFNLNDHGNCGDLDEGEGKTETDLEVGVNLLILSQRQQPFAALHEHTNISAPSLAFLTSTFNETNKIERISNRVVSIHSESSRRRIKTPSHKSSSKRQIIDLGNIIHIKNNNSHSNDDDILTLKIKCRLYNSNIPSSNDVLDTEGALMIWTVQTSLTFSGSHHDGNAKSLLERTGYNTVSGTFTLSFSSDKSVTVPHNVSELEMESKLYSLLFTENDDVLKMRDFIKVFRSINIHQIHEDTYTWTILLYATPNASTSTKLNVDGANLKAYGGVQITLSEETRNGNSAYQMQSGGILQFDISHTQPSPTIHFPNSNYRDGKQEIWMRGSINALNYYLDRSLFINDELSWFNTFIDVSLTEKDHDNLIDDLSLAIIIPPAVLTGDNFLQILWNQTSITSNTLNPPTIHMMEDDFLHFDTIASEESGLRISENSKSIRQIRFTIQSQHNASFCSIQPSKFPMKNEIIEKCTSTEKVLSRVDSITNMNQNVLSNLVYLPDENWWGTDKITIQALYDSDSSDKKESIIEAIMYVQVYPVNDSPIIHIKGVLNIGIPHVQDTWQNITISVNEDDENNQNLHGILYVSDIDIDSNHSREYDRLTLDLQVQNGYLSVENNQALFQSSFIIQQQQYEDSSSSPSSFLSITGKIHEINQALSTLKYTPILNFNGDDLLVCSVRDYGSSFPLSEKTRLIPNTSLSMKRFIHINVKKVNDLPGIILPIDEEEYLVAMEDVVGIIGASNTDEESNCNITSNTDAITSLENYIMSCKSIQIQDVDIIPSSHQEENFFTLTITPQYGSIRLSAATVPLSVSNKYANDTSTETTIVLKGSLQEINQALMQEMTYLSRPNFYSYDNIQITIHDYYGASSQTTLRVYVQGINDAPSLQISGGKEITTLEDEPVHDISISVQDVDVAIAQDDDFIFEVELYCLHGTLSLISYLHPPHLPSESHSDSITWITKSPNILQFQSSFSRVNQILRNITYVPNRNYYGIGEITVVVSDKGNHGFTQIMTNQGKVVSKALTELKDTIHLSINILPISDSPKWIIPSDDNIICEVLEDTPHILSDQISIKHVDDPNEKLKVSIMCNHCTLSLFQPHHPDITYDSPPLSSVISGVGTSKAWNHALSQIVYLSESNWNTFLSKNERIDDEIHFNVEVYNDTTKAAASTDSAILYVQVYPVNDAPFWNNIPGINVEQLDFGGHIVKSVDTLYVNEDEDLVLSEISVLDPDVMNEGAATVIVSISCLHGTIEPFTTAGLWILSSSPSSSSIKWKSSIQNANIALSQLIYQGNENYNGYDELTLFVSDDGNYGYNKLGYEELLFQADALNASVTIPIYVNEQIDQPYFILPENSDGNYPILFCGEEQICEIYSQLELVDIDSSTSTSNSSENLEIFHLEVSVHTGSLLFTIMEIPPSISFIDNDEGDDNIPDENFSLLPQLQKAKQSFHITGHLQDINFLLKSLSYVSLVGSNGMTDTLDLLGSNAKYYYNHSLSEVKAKSHIHFKITNEENNSPWIHHNEMIFDDLDCMSTTEITEMTSPGYQAESIQKWKKHEKEGNSNSTAIDCKKLVYMPHLNCSEDIQCPLQGFSVHDFDSDTLQLSIKVRYGRISLSRRSPNKGGDSLYGVFLVKGFVSHDSANHCSTTMAPAQLEAALDKERRELIIRGKKDQLNSILETLVYIGDVNFSGIDTLEIFIQDNTNAIKPSSIPASTDSRSMMTFYIDVESILDLPSIHMLDPTKKILHVEEDSYTAIDGIYISSAGVYPLPLSCDNQDKDLEKYSLEMIQEESYHVELKLNASDGTFTIQENNSIFILVIDAHEENSRGEYWWSNVLLRGSIPNINKALETLVYNPNKNWNSDDGDNNNGDEQHHYLRNTKLSIHVRYLEDHDYDGDEETNKHFDHSLHIDIQVKSVNDPPFFVFLGPIQYNELSTCINSSSHETTPSLFINFSNTDNQEEHTNEIHNVEMSVCEDEQVLLPVTVGDVDDHILTLKIRANGGKVRIENDEYFLKHNMIQKQEQNQHYNHYNAYDLDRGNESSWGEWLDVLEFRGHVHSLNSRLSTLRFVTDKDYDGGEESKSFIQLVVSDNNREQTLLIDVNIIPVDDHTELIIPVDHLGQEPITFVNEGEQVKIASTWDSSYIIGRKHKVTKGGEDNNNIMETQRLELYQAFAISDADYNTNGGRNNIYEVELKVEKGTLTIPKEEVSNLILDSIHNNNQHILRMYGSLLDINHVAKHIYFSSSNSIGENSDSSGWTQITVTVYSKVNDCNNRLFHSYNNDNSSEQEETSHTNHNNNDDEDDNGKLFNNILQVPIESCTEKIQGKILIFIIPTSPTLSIQWIKNMKESHYNDDDSSQPIEVGKKRLNKLAGFVVKRSGKSYDELGENIIHKRTFHVVIKVTSVTDSHQHDHNSDVNVSDSGSMISLATVNGLSFLEGNGIQDNYVIFYGALEDVNAACSGFEYYYNDHHEENNDAMIEVRIEISVTSYDDDESYILEAHDEINLRVIGQEVKKDHRKL